MKLKKLKVITECGMLLAVAMALSYVRLIRLPSGGSVSLGPLPLLLIGARHGTITGILSGLLFGLLSLARQPFIVHPLQFILDYPLAYAALGLAGSIRWTTGLKAAMAITIASIIRLHFHVIAGALFFVTDRETVSSALMVAYAYNLSYLVPEAIICTIIAAIMVNSHKDLTSRNED